jgi:DNA-binding transcriptional LysR family regulator
VKLDLPVTTVASTLDPLIFLAERSFGITCLPPFAVSPELAEGKLVSLLEDYLRETGTFRVLWPTNRYLSPKVRAFVDFMAENLFAA